MTDAAKPTTYQDVPGWFAWDDRAMFDILLNALHDHPGMLIELGCYLGKSAVIIGDHRRPGERFVVVDLFGSEAELSDDWMGHANKKENRWSYKTLTQTQFEANYLAFHAELPDVVQGLSTEVVKHVDPGSARFVHIDASHLYPQVAQDIANVRKLLAPGGVVVLDDFRTEHTPGVSAACWEAVISGGMIPFALTRSKMYAAWDDPTPHIEAVCAGVGPDTRLGYSEENVMGHRVIRVKLPKPAPPAAPPRLSAGEINAIAAKVAKKITPAVKTEVTRQVRAAKKPQPAGSPARALAKDVLPPVVVRALRNARRRARAR
jgi:predicted O-methyltransferase YrrM